jgi:hypothetical protein
MWCCLQFLTHFPISSVNVDTAMCRTASVNLVQLNYRKMFCSMLYVDQNLIKYMHSESHSNKQEWAHFTELNFTFSPEKLCSHSDPLIDNLEPYQHHGRRDKYESRLLASWDPHMACKILHAILLRMLLYLSAALELTSVLCSAEQCAYFILHLLWLQGQL